MTWTEQNTSMQCSVHTSDTEGCLCNCLTLIKQMHHAGGVGGLGLLFARLAVGSQAQRLTLLDVNEAALHNTPADLQSPDCSAEITVTKSDTATKGAADLLGRQRVDGLIHAAGVLRDALILKQTASGFREVLAGKVRPLPEVWLNPGRALQN